MTVLVFERHPIAEENVPAFESLAAELLPVVRIAPGALWATVARDHQDGPAFVLLSEWRTEEDADAWVTGPIAVRFAESADGLASGDVTRRRFSAP